MTKPRALIFLNGPEPQRLPSLSAETFSVAADGAWSYLHARGLEPDVCLGDFDSVSTARAQKSHTRFVRLNDQNTTDFDKALQFVLAQGYVQASVYGASGGDQDHFLGNLSSALAFASRIKLHFYDDRQQYFLAKAHNALTLAVGSTVSLLPFPDCQLGEVRGLRYPASYLSLRLGAGLSLRNQASEPQVMIEKRQGNLWIFTDHANR